MYILIFEDGTLEKTQVLQEGDLESADSGILTIVDISNPEDPKTYYNGKWEELPETEPYDNEEED